jgi:3',5'-cyclic AMP phosphodiesterase CpdA
MTLALAHLSDPHLPPGTMPPLWRLAGKRLLSYLAWQSKSQAMQGTRPLHALLGDLAAHAPDMVAVTGDLTNFALPGEFAAARAFLERLGPPGKVLAIPGNHDALAPVGWAEGPGQWGEYIAGDAPDPAGYRFPFLRRRGEVALIGLSTAIPTPPGSAAGRLGAGQIERLAALLPQLRQEGLCRVILIHHPPVRLQGGWRKALRDATALRAVLAREGAELVLHGHHHRASLVPLPGPQGPIPVIGVPLALADRPRPELARWHLYRIGREGAGWSLEAQVRGYDAAAEAFRPLGRWRLHLPARIGSDTGRGADPQ